MRPLAFILLLFFCAPAFAECSRSDVEYFLKQGFSRAQIAAICGGGGDDGRRRYAPAGAERQDAERRDSERRERERDVLFLENALAADDVVVTRRRLEYTTRICLASANNYDAEARGKICPDVRHRIYFAGLQVGDYERKYYILGQRQITVKGRVQRKLLHDFEEYPPELARRLKYQYRRKTRKQDEAQIPVRRDAPLRRVTEILKKYARAARRDKYARAARRDKYARAARRDGQRG